MRLRRPGVIRSRISAIASDCPWFNVSGGKSRLVGDLAADDVQGSYEGEPIGVEFGRIGCVGHECSDGIVGQQQAPEFLADQFGGFRPKSLSWCEKLSFDLAERHPVFPPLLIRCG